MPSVPASATAERLNSRSSVTVVDRPMRLATLVSAVRAALRSRVRQLEVRELIEALRGAQVEAERANRVKGEFLAIMSHELRTPLNAIAGYAELLDSGCYGEVTPEQRQALARMSRAQRHLLGLINDLLNFARVERGRVEYAIEPVSVIEALADVAPLIEPQLQAKGLAYDVVPPQRDLRVAADRDKLRQILVNILSNALKFTPRGGRVGLRVTAPEPDGDGSRRVRIEVTDTGPGIPADKLDTIFDPFVQVRVDPTTAREGTGLGLAISRDLAHGMGGDLRATSAVGQGSTFIIDLPRA
jgi:signal transduction histidine kinase